jgi:hypothetical protein
MLILANYNMDNINDYDFNNDINEDNIRQHDTVITERLVDDDLDDLYEFEDIISTPREQVTNNSILDKDINNAFEESKKEFEDMINREDEYEKKVIQDYLTMVEANKAKFQTLINDLNRLSKFDNDIREIYDIIEPIIHAHSANLLPVVEFDTITYDRIYKVLGSIRTDKNCIEELKKVIICEI